MLVLSRKKGDAVIIAGSVSVRVIDVKGDVVRLGVEAPREIPVHRHEVFARLQSSASPLEQRAPQGHRLEAAGLRGQ
ncbi:MAG TPA: carbon storage regulator CsrA [Pirellulales bacterium]|nr:carbon storage regulator CsrA [Pirellulales bacterium]